MLQVNLVTEEAAGSLLLGTNSALLQQHRHPAKGERTISFSMDQVGLAWSLHCCWVAGLRPAGLRLHVAEWLECAHRCLCHASSRRQAFGMSHCCQSMALCTGQQRRCCPQCTPVPLHTAQLQQL